METLDLTVGLVAACFLWLCFFQTHFYISLCAVLVPFLPSPHMTESPPHSICSPLGEEIHSCLAVFQG